MSALFLLLTIICETAAVICMKLSAGFVNRFYTIVAIATYALSFIFLTKALKQMPAGIANALWAGASTLLVALLSLYIFKERLNAVQWFSIVLITAGLVGLHYRPASS